MSNIVEELGDKTSHSVKPDFDSGKGYYWMKQTYELRKAISNGEEVVPPPYKRRKGLAEESFFEQVDRRLSRISYVINVTFDKEGKIHYEGV